MNFTACKALIISSVLALIWSATGSMAWAEKKPLFELGVAGGGGYLPDYPAAGQNHFNGIALPFPIYRGEFFRSDSKGLLRGRLIHSRDFELDVSLSGSLDADSDDNDARRGMPDLDHMAEVGPRIQWTIARAAKWAKIDVELLLRAVFSTDFSSLEHRGYLAEPQIAYQHGNLFETGMKLKLGLSTTFASEDLQDYFYQVEAPFVTNSRPLYDAKGGYLGSRVRLSLLYPLGKHLRLFTIGDIYSQHGAANQDSPLYREDITFGFGLGLIWSFYQSDSIVDE